MKLASIFLLAAYVLVISNQQLHNPKLLGRRLYWWHTTDRQSPHYPANNNNGPVLFNNDQSVNHPNYNQFQNDIPVSFHQFKPGKPSLIQNDVTHPSSDHQNEVVELFPDSQLRTNGLSRYRPDIIRGSLELLPQDRRLFFSGITLSTFFTKTVTFSVTVPLTLTTTTSCIPLALFAVPTKTSACRRKREISLDYVLIIPEEYNQFGIVTSQTQEIILPTAVIPLPGANRLNRQVSVDQSDQLSADDVIPGSLSPERHVVRGKRYFIMSITSTTVTTYSITSTAAIQSQSDWQVTCKFYVYLLATLFVDRSSAVNSAEFV